MAPSSECLFLFFRVGFTVSSAGTQEDKRTETGTISVIGHEIADAMSNPGGDGRDTDSLGIDSS